MAEEHIVFYTLLHAYANKQRCVDGASIAHLAVGSCDVL
jgi:hypothetical protein